MPNPYRAILSSHQKERRTYDLQQCHLTEARVYGSISIKCPEEENPQKGDSRLLGRGEGGIRRDGLAFWGDENITH